MSRSGARGPPPSGIERLSESYWELRYESGQLKSRVTRLEVETGLRRALPDPEGGQPPAATTLRSSVVAEKMTREFDVIVIGAGTGGYVAAIRAAQLGLQVAVVEKQKALGGTCLIWGCIPTKALLEHAHALKIVQGAKEWGITLGPRGPGGGSVGIDMTQVHARKDRIVDRPDEGRRVPVQEKQDRVDQGHRAADRQRRRRGVRRGNADAARPRDIIVATGSAPRSVPGITIDRKRIITSDEAIHLKEVPKSIAIMGSGAVGVEFASIFRRFGSDVTILELLPHLVPIEDEAVSAELEKSFRKQGITAHTGAQGHERGGVRRRGGRRGHARRRQDAKDSAPTICSWRPAADR